MKWSVLLLCMLACHIPYAQNATNDLLQQLHVSKNDSARVALYRKISELYMYTRPDSSTWYAREGLVLSRKTHIRKGEASLLCQIGQINQIHGNLNLSRKYLLEALDLSRDIHYPEGIGAACSGLGVIEGKNGNLGEATRYFIEALKMAEQSNNTGGIIETNIKLGLVNELNNNLDKALYYYSRAEKLNKTQPVSSSSFTLMNNIGIVYAKKGDVQTALQYFEKGIAQSDTPRFAGIHLNLLGNAGNAFEHLGNKEKALEYHKRMLNKAQLIRMPEEEARALVNLATVLKKDSAVKSIQYLNSALGIAQKLNLKELQSLIFKSLSEIYKQQQNYQSALQALEQHHRVEDSLFNLTRTREIATLEASYELEESRNKIQKLELVNQQRTFERNIGGIIAVSVLIILVILAIYVAKTRRLNKELKDSNQVKDKLFSIIGHDLSGPVAGTTNLLSLMNEGDFTPDEQKQMLAELHKQSELTATVLNSLLNWGKTQLQGVKVHTIAFAPLEIVQKNLLVLQSMANNKQIAMSAGVPAGICIRADQDHFDFIIRNLVSNAIKFTHSMGAIHITAEASQQKDIVTFSVKDNGTGISEEIRSQLFNINPKRSYGTKGEKGTGLGLMLCREFVEANKGRIWLESAEGAGTTFYFTLPAAPSV